jgi:hypothetical protein
VGRIGDAIAVCRAATVATGVAIRRHSCCARRRGTEGTPPSPTPPPTLSSLPPLPPATTRGPAPPAAGCHLPSPLEPVSPSLALTWLPDPLLPSPLPSAAAPQGRRRSNPYPFEYPTAAFHQCSIGCCVCRLYVCYVDRLEQYLLLSLDWLVAARSVEETAGGRLPAACMLLQAYAHARASLSRDPVPLTVYVRLQSWQAGRVRQGPILSTSFCRGFHFAVQKHLGESLHHAALSRMQLAWAIVIGHD